MNHLLKRYTILVALGATLCAFAATVPARSDNTAAAAPQPVAEYIGTMTITGRLNITRSIYRPISDIQVVVDMCIGAVVVEDATPGTLYLAAHRTSCGANGFGGVEALSDGDVVTVSLNGHAPTTYEFQAGDIGTYEAGAAAPPIGTQLTLQTSVNSTQFYLKHFKPVGLPEPQTNSGRRVTQGNPGCAAVPGANKNDWVFVNVTPVRAEGPGFTTVYPAGDNTIVPDTATQPSTSTANWTSRAPSPNTTLVQVGDRSMVCAATFGKPVDIIFDALAIAQPDTFNAAHQRLIDTRRTGQTVNRGSVCFSVPNAAGKWTVLNLTVIGRAHGWGRLQSLANAQNYSSVNFRAGDVDTNMVVIKVPSDGRLCYYGSARSDAVVDLIATAKAGTFRDAATLPNRAAYQRQSSFETLAISTRAYGGVGNGWAIVNATPIPYGTGHARVYDCQLHPATGSDVNYGPRVDPNVAIIKTGPNAELCMASSGSRPGWVLDVLAVANPNVFTTPPERRIFDSRRQ